MLGADAVLLIAAILDDTTLKEFMSIAESLGLDCLTEVHDIEEMKRVNNLGAKIVGINNRNLKTFEEDLHTTERLTAGLENRSEKAVVSESGIKNNTDLRYLRDFGYRCGSDWRELYAAAGYCRSSQLNARIIKF